MAALPYIQFYIADYLADTAHLTTEQHGAYLLLIFNYWQRGQPLNNANERLASVARMSNDVWETHKQTLAEFFEVDGNTWSNARIEEDLELVASKSTKASMAGKASGARRRAISTRQANGRSTDVQRTVNHTEAEAEAEADTDKDQELLPIPSGMGVGFPDGNHDDPPDEREKVTTNGHRVLPAVPFQKIVDIYHETLPGSPKVEVLTKTRKGYLRQRWSGELPTLDAWRNYFADVSASRFLTGKTAGTNGKPPFIANLEWLCKPGNFAKVAEGNYHR